MIDFPRLLRTLSDEGVELIIVGRPKDFEAIAELEALRDDGG